MSTTGRSVGSREWNTKWVWCQRPSFIWNIENIRIRATFLYPQFLVCFECFKFSNDITCNKQDNWISVLPSRNPPRLLAPTLLPPQIPPHSRPWISQTPVQQADPQLTSKLGHPGSGWWCAARPLSSAGGGSSSEHDQHWLLAREKEMVNKFILCVTFINIL